MVPLPMVVLGEIMQCPSQRRLAEEDHATQAFLLDGAHEPLGVGVAIRRSGRTLNCLNSGVGKDALEVLTELRVSIVDEDPIAVQEPVFNICELPGVVVQRLLESGQRAGIPVTTGRYSVLLVFS